MKDTLKDTLKDTFKDTLQKLKEVATKNEIKDFEKGEIIDYYSKMLLDKYYEANINDVNLKSFLVLLKTKKSDNFEVRLFDTNYKPLYDYENCEKIEYWDFFENEAEIIGEIFFTKEKSKIILNIRLSTTEIF